MCDSFLSKAWDLLYECSFFLQNPIKDCSLPITSTEKWFTDEDVARKREALRALVVELQTKLNPDLNFSYDSLTSNNGTTAQSDNQSGSISDALQQQSSTKVELKRGDLIREDAVSLMASLSLSESVSRGFRQ